MRAALTIVKLGGSLVADSGRLRARLAALAAGEAGPCILVPGGGPLAEAVRTTQAALGFPDALAHRLALDAMGRMAEIFCALEPHQAALTASRAAGRTPVWDPVALKDGHSDIPETWDVTSDSLAVWLATALGAPLCRLVKSADRPAGMSWSDLAGIGLVDAAFPAFAARYVGRIEILGPGAEAVRAAA
jgi:5-(aminomethyl)-3-furanmethanol phosphate kinase